MTRLKVMGRALGTAPQRVALPPKVADQHYRSAEHRDWSRAVIARAGGACQGCGATGGRLFADHTVELKDGGAATDLGNGQALCGSCHSAKTAAARRARHQG